MPKTAEPWLRSLCVANLPAAHANFTRMADHGVTLDLLDADQRAVRRRRADARRSGHGDQQPGAVHRRVAQSDGDGRAVRARSRRPAQPAADFFDEPVPQRPVGRRPGSVRPAADDRRSAGGPAGARRRNRQRSPRAAATTPKCWRRCGDSSAARRCGSPTATSCATSRSKRSCGRFRTWPTRSSKPRSISPAAILHEQYGQPLRADGERSRFVVLGLGKLGGVELNYSSDIDLIFLYEQDGQTDARRTVSNQEYFERLSKEVIRLLTEATDLGAAYRVDLRLRPEGSRGPLVHELRQHALVLRREGPHVGAAGVRQSPADCRRSRAWAATCSRGSSRGSIASTSAWPTSRASSRSSAASSSASSAKAATCAT